MLDSPSGAVVKRTQMNPGVWLVIGGLGLLLSRPALASTPVSKDAQAHFNAGVSFLQDPDGARYEEAYLEFKAAYADSPSWKILGNLGITALKLERDGEAIEAFRKYLAEGGTELDPEEKAQVERDLATLEASSARVVLEVPEGAVVLDERFPATGAAIRNSYRATAGKLEIGVRPGRHRFTATLQGKNSPWEIELQPKEQQAHTFSFDAGSAPSTTPRSSGNGLRTASFVAFGVGAVGAGVGTYFALQAADKYDQGNALCPSSGTCTLTSAKDRERKQLGEDGDSAKTISLVGFIAGGVGVVGGVTLLLLSSGKRSEKAQVTPYIGASELGLVGRF
jgi:hypothetical protein